MNVLLSTLSFPSAASVMVVAALLGFVGAVAGCAARLLLRRLRRGARVPPPWCELGVAVTWGTTGAGVGARVLPLDRLPVLLALGWFTVAAGAVDVLHHRLPDALTLPALPLVLLLLVPLGSAALWRGLGGAAVAFAAYAAVHLAVPDALGAGDVKLAAPLGAVLAAASWPALVLAGGLSALLSGGMAAAVLASARWRGRPRGAALPHGPPMVIAGWVVTLLAAAPDPATVG